MKKLLFAFAALVVVAFAVPDAAFASFTPEQEARSRLNGAKRAGIPLDNVIFSNPDQMDTYLRDNLKSHRVIKGKDWDAMSDEQKKTAIDNLSKNNPNNYHIELRTGDICSFAGESTLRGALIRSDSDLGGRLDIPDGILTDEEKSERTRLQMEDLKRRTSQPPENPGHASADRDHDWSDGAGRPRAGSPGCLLHLNRARLRRSNPEPPPSSWRRIR